MTEDQADPAAQPHGEKHQGHYHGPLQDRVTDNIGSQG